MNQYLSQQRSIKLYLQSADVADRAITYLNTREKLRVVELFNAARQIEMLAEQDPTQAFKLQQLRTQIPQDISHNALHITSICLLSNLMCQAMQLDKKSTQSISRAAFIAPLIHAHENCLVTAALVCEESTARRYRRLCKALEHEVDGSVDIKTSLLISTQYKSGLWTTDKTKTHAAARLVGAAAAYDALVNPFPGKTKTYSSRSFANSGSQHTYRF